MCYYVRTKANYLNEKNNRCDYLYDISFSHETHCRSMDYQVQVTKYIREKVCNVM